MEGAVATVAAVDIAGEVGKCDLDVVGPARVGVIRGRGRGIRVGVMEALAEGGIGFPCSPRPELGIEAVLDEDRDLDQSEVEGTVLIVVVLSTTCSASMVLPTFDVLFPGPTVLVCPEPGGRTVILLTTFAEPGVTPGSCS
jgi:hypothetical protein